VKEGTGDPGERQGASVDESVVTRGAGVELRQETEIEESSEFRVQSSELK
jgi:hypothetical protein